MDITDIFQSSRTVRYNIVQLYRDFTIILPYYFFEIHFFESSKKTFLVPISTYVTMNLILVPNHYFYI